MGYLIVLVALFGLMWLFLIRPQRRRAGRADARCRTTSRAGDEILTAGGIHGDGPRDRGRGRPARDRAGHDRPPRPAGGRRAVVRRKPSRSRDEIEPEAERASPRPAKANLSRLRVSNRRSHLILVGLILAALAGVVALAFPSSPVHKKVDARPRPAGRPRGRPEGGAAEPGKTCDAACMDRSVSIMRSRIDKLGVSEPEIRKQGKDQIVIQLAGVHDAEQGRADHRQDRPAAVLRPRGRRRSGPRTTARGTRSPRPASTTC